MISPQKAGCIHHYGTKFWDLQYSMEHHGKKAIALLAYPANHNDTFINCGVCEGEAVCVTAYLLSVGAKDVYKTNTANEKKTDARVYHGTWPVVINALIKRF